MRGRPHRYTVNFIPWDRCSCSQLCGSSPVSPALVPFSQAGSKFYTSRAECANRAHIELCFVAFQWGMTFVAFWDFAHFFLPLKITGSYLSLVSAYFGQPQKVDRACEIKHMRNPDRPESLNKCWPQSQKSLELFPVSWPIHSLSPLKYTVLHISTAIMLVF